MRSVRAPGGQSTLQGATPITMDLQLNGKTALVTGSTAGIGLAIASALAGESARVIINGRTSKRVDQAMGTIRASHPGASLDALPLDLSTAAGAADAIARFPDVDVLVNNLGIFEPKPFDDIPDADWLRFFETNVMSGVRLSRAYLPKMRAKNLGPHRVHFQRVGPAHPGRDGALRRHQVGADCGSAGHCRDVCRHRGYV